MDWDLKTPLWDLAELEREAIPNLNPRVGSNDLGSQKSKGDFSVDLKLGRLGDFGDGSVDKLKEQRISTMVSASPSSSSKRARAPNNANQMASCLVEGCTSDLSNCRDYHRRHKVCEVHSKTPTVMVGGQAQRFCQQCSRFHVLAEFDEVKRSCRKRLDGHNRRRRKPQPESHPMNSGSFFSNHQGSRLSPFTSPQIFSPTSMVNATWTGVVKTEEDATLYNGHFINRQNPYTGSFSYNYKGGGKQFSFAQSNATTLANQTAPEASVCQPLLNTIASSQSEGGRNIFSNEFSRVHDSDCALSLLSSPSTQTSGISLNHVVQPESIPMANPLVPSLQYSGLGRYPSSRGMEDEQVGSVLVSETSDADLHCEGIFHVGSDGSSQNVGQQTLPFAW
ncbi:squamosa promoter-binding-like protein 16 [Macadamia integrifolia]|uniref:squamosa promoter-binding-like protein 16 n=1 Tax=Macadamia integrifolia TaxID=60698 RepID=UPI001C52A092|nr:squamosa promoter-binding-like protein 16 [Macadamia integrifolia]XP_042478587.1 squamosa promoter-binding-like protein 16 [Macadamia integrifolia]XP_042478588.1 squamosa promoter-binding-like protein 16 [Macadamia integrifolia]XP_042478589.1 squamosa promoter-binding-like protein 16 [Macadamia integrifolia]